MADPNTRQGKRTPVTLKIKFKSETLEQFIERYAVDVSQGGIFIRTKEPLAVGTQMKFEFQLRDASPLIAGEGTVVWTRENDPSRPAIAPGMGVRFDKLAEGSQAVLEKILAEKQKQAPSRGGNEATTKPPMFTDTPTKVAPAPLQEALGVGKRRREDSEQTPLPKPMPFHSDAEDFDERAFEEATKVRSLDELAAATAGEESAPPPADDTKTATKLMPPDELAARRQQGRADSTLADPPLNEPPAESFGAKAMPDRDSAPGLPPSPDGPRPRAAEPGPRSGKMPAQDDVANRTLAGHEPAKAATSARARNESSGARAVAADTALPAAPKRPSSLPIILGILLVVAGAIAAIYFLFLKESPQEPTSTNTNKGSATVVDKGSAGSATVVDNGSAGSATAMTGSAGSAAQGSAATGSATTMAAGSAAHPVDTVIASNVSKGANVEIVGTDMKGAAPFTAKLEKDQAYKAKVSAPGYVTQEIDIKGGQDKVTAKLVAKPKVISVTSTPAGADIAIDGALTGKLTPADITLSASQAARPKIHVTLRRPGYRPLDQIVDAATFTEDDAGLTATINATLTVAPKVVPTGNGGTTTTNTGSGSASTGTGSGSATPTTTGTGTGTGTGSASTGTGGGTTTTPPAGGTTTPPAGGTTTTPPAGGTTTPTPPTPPAGGASTGSASSGQVLK